MAGLELSVVIPVYEQAQLLSHRLPAVFEHLEARGGAWEVIVVSDGCGDGVEEVLAPLLREEARCRLLRLGRNRGKGAAIRQGVLEARGERVLFSDADFSTPIAELGRLEAALEGGADLAIASRRAPGAQVELDQPPLRRALGAAFRVAAALATGLPCADFNCGFKLFRRPVARRLFADLREERFAFDLELLCRARALGYRVEEVGVRWRHSGDSTVRPLRDAPPALARLARLGLAERGPELGLLLVAAFLLLGGLGVRSLWGIEGRWAECARWMHLSGDLLTPQIDGVPYRLKPAPSYWPALLFAGGAVDEVAVRLPSALAGLATLVATMGLGRLWRGRAVGLLAGGVLLSVGMFGFWARTGSGDLLTVALSTWALLLLERARRGEGDLRALYGAALCCALGSLAKGLLGFALPAVALVGVTLAEGRPLRSDLRRWWAGGHALLALGLALLLYAAPFAAERLSLGHWESLREAYRHSVGRFFGELPDGGSEGPAFYAYYVLALALPWSLWLPLALRRPWRAPLGAALAILAFFTLSSSRRSYYLLPILPSLALLIAGAWLREGPRDRWEVALRRGPLLLLGGLCLVAAFVLPWAPSLLPPGLDPRVLPPLLLSLLTAIGLSGLLWGAAWLDRSGRRGRAAWLAVSAFALAGAFAHYVALPAAEAGRTLRPFALAARARLGSEAVVVPHDTGSRLPFYLGRLRRSPRPGEVDAAQARFRIVHTHEGLPAGWRVALRERRAPSGVEVDPGPCASCVARRRRRCKHYLLLERTP